MKGILGSFKFAAEIVPLVRLKHCILFDLQGNKIFRQLLRDQIIYFPRSQQGIVPLSSKGDYNNRAWQAMTSTRDLQICCNLTFCVLLCFRSSQGSGNLFRRSALDILYSMSMHVDDSPCAAMSLQTFSSSSSDDLEPFDGF